MTQKVYQKASKAYQGSQDSNLTPLQIVVELYKGLLKNTHQCKMAYERGDFAEIARLNQNSFDIIDALQSNLDFEQGGDDAKFLDDFYTVVFRKMMRTLSVVDPAAEFQSIIDYIQPVYDRWYSFAYGNQADQVNAPGAESPADTGPIVRLDEDVSA